MKKRGLQEVLEGIEDTQRERSVWYPLNEVLFIMLAAVIFQQSAVWCWDNWRVGKRATKLLLLRKKIGKKRVAKEIRDTGRMML